MAVMLTLIGASQVYLQFEQDFGSWKKGQVPTDPIPDGVARSLVDSGQAKEIDLATYLARSIESEMSKVKAELVEQTRAGLQSKPAPKGPPNGGGNVNFERISNTSEAPEDRGPKRSFAEIPKLVFFAQALGTPPEQRQWAINRLRNVYGAERCDYQVDEATGELTETITRTLDYGVETVTRTGTESMGGGPTYGFAVKPEFSNQLFELPIEQTVFVDGAFSVPIGNALELHIPALGQYTAPTTVAGIQHSAAFAGVQLYYKGETAQRTSSDANLTDIVFKIVDLTAMTDFSRDLLADNYLSIDSVVLRLFSRAISWMEDYMSIWGDGLGKPEGFLRSRACITGGTQSTGTAREDSNDIRIEDLTYMLSHLHPMCWGRARWIASITTIPKIAILRDTGGTAVYQPNALIAQSQTYSVTDRTTYDAGSKTYRPQGVLLGLPIYFSEKVPALGTRGDISLVCPSEYGNARRAGVEIGLSEHFYFDTDRVAYRIKMRHDMRSMWKAPFTLADGSSTQVSPFVSLAA